MKRYEMYKDSGIEWIGEIPINWNQKRLKYITDIDKKKLSEKTDPEFSFQYIDIGSVSNHCIADTIEMRFENSPSRARKIVEKGDIIVSTVRTYLRAIARIDKSNKYICSTGFCVITGKELFIDFLYYFCLCEYFIQTIVSQSIGVSYPAISSSAIGNLAILMPSQNEQRTIAAYLDQKTSAIDELTADKSQMIELLREKRQAIISEAVTKGLDRTVPMKDSGIEWIGEVPEHWSIAPLTKKLSSIIDYRGKTPEKVLDGIFLVTARNIKGGRINYELSKEYIPEDQYNEVMHRGKPVLGDVLFTTEAPLGEVANVDDENIALAQRIIKFSGNPYFLYNYFLKYWMLSTGFKNHLLSLSTGSTAEGIKASKLFNLKVTLPPIDEQIKIFVYLDEQTKQVDTLITNIEAQIDLLKEYRQSLISEVVTGKVKVCEEAS